MSIKFVCVCGKHLRAREEMAARRVLCPQCRVLVGVPSLQPTHPGTAANPMSPEERRRHARQRPPAVATEDGRRNPAADAAELLLDGLVPGAGSGPIDPTELVGLRAKPPRRREARWYHCLAYPCRAWPLVVGLGLAWAVWAVCSAAVPPTMFEPAKDPAWPWLVGLFWLLGTLAVAGYTAGFLDCTLSSSAAGEVARVRWPANDLRLVVRSLGRWLFAFLAGPALLLGAGFSYWLHGGELGLLDWVILGELSLLAVAYGVLAVAAAAEREWFLDANPLAVARLAFRLGWGTLAVLVAAVVALGHGWLVVAALEAGRHSLARFTPDQFGIVMRLPRHTVAFAPRDTSGELLAAGLRLVLTCVSALFLATFLFRLLGMWCFRSRSLPAAATPPPAT